MRKIEYLSPTSIAAWIQDRDEWYLRYGTENRPPRPPQTRPMSVGSAFDAYVKASLHAALGGNDPVYGFEALFEAQVEEHNRDWAREHGKHVFESYKAVGAYGALLELLRTSETMPRFEFELRAPVTHQGESVVLLGKPDLAFTLNGASIVYDFKVNGYCGKASTSPFPGFVNLRGGSRGVGAPHKDCQVAEVHGIKINTRAGLESVKPDWARQLAIYAWLLDAPVGSDFICGIDQLVANPTKREIPEIRVAEHRYRIGPMFQQMLFATALAIHAAVARDHIFDDLTPEADKQRRKALDQMAGAFDPTSETDRMFMAMTR